MAEDSGYISFTMKLDPFEKNTLLCTYWGMDNRGRNFDIMVDETKIAGEDLDKFKSSRFYEIAYAIPPGLTRNKNSAVIKFIPKPYNSAGPIYGVRMAKGDVSGFITSK